ncbi:DUF397 domain-containing protein [Streptomyces sp. NPDC059679]|uniref:DUF397 domain-containing protein n=1 Tax=Streptomyces sp. NPDC059679 TaxID=3346903 RepID=UPI0036BCE369
MKLGSSYSDGTGNNCVEIADRLQTHGDVLVRDSKDKSGPALHFTRDGRAELLAFVRTERAGSRMI